MVNKSHYLQRFLVTNPKIFLKGPLAPLYTNIERGARAKKTQFFFKIFQKVPENDFLFKIRLFSVLLAGLEKLIWSKNGYSVSVCLLILVGFLPQHQVCSKFNSFIFKFKIVSMYSGFGQLIEI